MWEMLVTRLDRTQSVVLTVLVLALAGCNTQSVNSPSATTADVTEPLNLLLPSEIQIHPFTGTRSFDRAGGVNGIDVRTKLIDGFGDTTKGFGDFRFEMYQFRPNSPDPRGPRISTWQISLMSAKDNLGHWDNITRTYEFKLQWDKPIPVGQRFVLVAVFDSPYTERLFAQRVFISGE